MSCLRARSRAHPSLCAWGSLGRSRATPARSAAAACARCSPGSRSTPAAPVPRGALIDALWEDDAARPTRRTRCSPSSRGCAGRSATRRSSRRRRAATGWRSRPRTSTRTRFERLAREGGAALRAGDPAAPATLLREALALWRGPALGRPRRRPLRRGGRGRLEDLRLARASADRIEAELALGPTAPAGRRARGARRRAPARRAARRAAARARCRRRPPGRRAGRLRGMRAAGSTTSSASTRRPSCRPRTLAVLRGEAPPRGAGRRAHQPAARRAHQLRRPRRASSRASRELLDAPPARHARRPRRRRQDPAGRARPRPRGRPARRRRLARRARAGHRARPTSAGAVLGALGLREARLLEPQRAGCRARRASTGCVDALADARRAARARQLRAPRRRPRRSSPTSCSPAARAAHPGHQPRAARRSPASSCVAVPPLGLPGRRRRRRRGARRTRRCELFADRGAAASPGFAVDDDNVAAVVEICRRLDGLPLAIELAAARLRSLPLEQIADRLDDRFRLLTGGSRTALPAPAHPARGRRLELGPARRRRARARRAGSRSSPAASRSRAPAAVPATASTPTTSLDLLAALVDHSLLQVGDAGATRATGCSRRSASTASSGWRRPASSRGRAPRTRATSPRSSTRPSRTCAAPEQLAWLAPAAPPSATTSSPRCATLVDTGDAAPRAAAGRRARLVLAAVGQPRRGDGRDAARARACPARRTRSTALIVAAIVARSTSLVDSGDGDEERGRPSVLDELAPSRARERRPLVARWSARAAGARAVRRRRASAPTAVRATRAAHPDPWVRAAVPLARAQLRRERRRRRRRCAPTSTRRCAAFRAVGDRWGAGDRADRRWAALLHARGRPRRRAAAALEEARELLDELGAAGRATRCSTLRLADVRTRQGDLDGALRATRSGARRQRPRRATSGAIAIAALARVAWLRGERDEARGALRASAMAASPSAAGRRARPRATPRADASARRRRSIALDDGDADAAARAARPPTTAAVGARDMPIVGDGRRRASRPRSRAGPAARRRRDPRRGRARCAAREDATEPDDRTLTARLREALGDDGVRRGLRARPRRSTRDAAVARLDPAPLRAQTRRR